MNINFIVIAFAYVISDFVVLLQNCISIIKSFCYKLWKEYFDERSKERGIWYKTIQPQPLRLPWFDDVTNDVQQMPTSKISVNEYVPTPDTWQMNPDLKSMWVYRPPSIQSQQSDEQMTHRVVFKVPHLLTRLAKPLSYGFDPFFHKALFEPFERRPKPVTLVAFRKNGVLPRQAIGTGQSNPGSAEVAEMQSAFNDVSSFWHDVPGLVNE